MIRRKYLLGLLALSGLALPGCGNDDGLFGKVSDSKTDPISEVGDFPGCISAQPIDTSRILIKLAIPPGGEKMGIYRDGVVVAAVFDIESTTFIDTGLNEGQTYRYICEVSIGGRSKLGNNRVTASTLVVNPPSFAGAAAATALASDTVLVSWLPPGRNGSAAQSFAVYANLGATVNFNLPPRATGGLGATSATLSGLGDELPYAFGVRACSATGVCDTNTVTAAIATMPDAGAPRTPGATGLSAANGAVSIQAPWAESMGAVKVRRVFKSTTAPFTPSPSTLAQTITVTDFTAPPPDVLVVTNGISENSDYFFIVQDEDRSGHVNGNLTTAHIRTGDLTPPAFTGLNGPLASGATGFADTQLVAHFLPIAAEGTADSGAAAGATYYLGYITSDLSQDPCGFNSLNAATSAVSQPGGHVKVLAAATSGATRTFPPAVDSTLTFTGLAPRTTYRVCVKAQDAALNISTNANSANRSTADITPPVFFGIESATFDNAAAKLNVYFTPSSSADTDHYNIRFWKNTATPPGSDVTLISKPKAGVLTNIRDPATGALKSGIQFTLSEVTFSDSTSLASLTSTDHVFMVVDACDDAHLVPLSPPPADNCTATPLASAISLLVPDISPPQGFEGIASAAQLTTPAEGQVLVKWLWSPPAVTAPQLADYAGFNVYHVDSSGSPDRCVNAGGDSAARVDSGGNVLCLLAHCDCTTPGSCGADLPHDTQCLVTNLKPFKTYKFFVKAADLVGNESNNNSPTVNSLKQATDLTPPQFSSGLRKGAVTVLNPSIWIWNQISFDNQDSGEPGAVVRYDLFRRQGAFTNASQPFLDGAALTTITQAANAAAGTLTFTDSTVLEGQSYTYAVCARDSSGNRACDGATQTLTVGDSTAPTLSGTVIVDPGTTTPKTPKTRKFDLRWTMFDNVTSTSNLRVSIFRRNTLESEGPVTATTSDTALNHSSCGGPCLNVTGLPAAGGGSLPAGSGAGNAGTAILAGLTGAQGVRGYSNFLISVTDAAGLSRTAAITIFTDNQITIGTVKRNLGKIAGGNLLLVTGTGFIKASEAGDGVATTITLAAGAFSATCGSDTIWDDKHITCRVPAGPGAGGPVAVTVRNSDGSSATVSGGYTYQDNAHPCDLAPAGDFAATSGNGTTTGPFKICTTAQLATIANTAPTNYLGGGFSFQLEDNLDLSSGAQSDLTAPIGSTAASFIGHFNGNGLTMTGWNFSNPTRDAAGLFGQVGACTNHCAFPSQGSAPCNKAFNGCYFINSNLLSFNVAAQRGVGLLVGQLTGTSLSWFDGNVVQGTLSGVSGVGGMVGLALGPQAGSIGNCSANVTISATHGANNDSMIGGLAGGSIGRIFNSSATGSITVTAGSGLANIGMAGGLAGSSSCTTAATSCTTTSCSATNRCPTVHADNVSASVAITVTSASTYGNVGGLFGFVQGSSSGITEPPPVIQNCSATGNISVQKGSSIGGLIGNAKPTFVQNCKASGRVQADGAGNQNIGGLLGTLSTFSNQEAAVKRSFATGDVSNNVNSGTTTNAGGLIGAAQSTPSAGPGAIVISDSYSQGAVTGSGSIGGLVGTATIGLSTATVPVSIQNAFSTGSVTGFTATNIGGLVGIINNASITISNSFFDSTVAPIVAVGSGSSTGVTGEPTATMQPTNPVTNVFTGAGWDFTTIWKVPSTAGYPQLR